MTAPEPDVAARIAAIEAEMLRTLCVDHGHDRREGGMNCRTCKRRVAALLPLMERFAAEHTAAELRAVANTHGAGGLVPSWYLTDRADAAIAVITTPVGADGGAE